VCGTHADRDRDAYGRGHPTRVADACAAGHIYTNAHREPNEHASAHADADGHGQRDAAAEYADGVRDTQLNAGSHGNPHPDVQCDADAHAGSHADAERDTDAHAAPDTDSLGYSQLDAHANPHATVFDRLRLPNRAALHRWGPMRRGHRAGLLLRYRTLSSRRAMSARRRDVHAVRRVHAHPHPNGHADAVGHAEPHAAGQHADPQRDANAHANPLADAQSHATLSLGL
jgi:hypothetical protein